MRSLLLDEADSFLGALAELPVTGLRVNSLKTTPEAFRALLDMPLEPVSWCPTGFVLPELSPGGKHPFHAAGLYYLQEPSAMAVAEVLAPQPGDWVIDLAAAPGGKTTHIASLMQNQGLLVANEVDYKRAGALLQNLERWGVHNTIVTNEGIARLARNWAAVFDRVLLDAPCSGEGMFRKSDEALRMWSEANIQHCALRQDRLLAQAAELVKPQGILVYSTCTFAPEENEGVIIGFLKQHPDFSLESINLPGVSSGQSVVLPAEVHHPDLTKTLRLWPHHLRGEGHFIAKLRRTSGESTSLQQQRVTELSSRHMALVRQFFGNLKLSEFFADARLMAVHDKVYALPQRSPALSKLRVLRPGLWLGTLRKNRFEPSHSLALALPQHCAQALPHIDLRLEDPDLARYLLGDILEQPGADGWMLVLVQGFALGWAKRSQNIVKNAYPKGLRMAFTA